MLEDINTTNSSQTNNVRYLQCKDVLIFPIPWVHGMRSELASHLLVSGTAGRPRINDV